MDNVLTIILSVIGSTGLFTFVQYLITRHDTKSNKEEYIQGELKEVRLDLCRTQLLLLISNYPNEEAELMKVAQRYFSELKGDWYMTTIFNRYLKNNNIAIPDWFTEHD